MQVQRSDFQEGEFETAHNKLNQFVEDTETLRAEVTRYFSQYDNDGNQWLDRRELRQFLVSFFEQYHIRLPITDEYVDGVFRQIDQNHDNKIQPEELLAFAQAYIAQLKAAFDAAASASAEEVKE